MAKKYDDVGGVWRTIGGRRVFIKDGQDLASAMKESGKFKKGKGSNEYLKIEQRQHDDMLKNKFGIDKEKMTNEQYEKSLNDYREHNKIKTEMLNEEEFTKKIQEIQERPSYKEKMDKAVQELNEKYGYDNKNNNWQEQIKANNAQTEKDVTDLQNKINEYRNRSINAKDGLERYQLLKEADNLTNQYYERFRENERANAKIKVESPNEKYMNVEAYAGYKDKFNETWGKDGSNDKVVSAKMYSNDEFMEHLEDANWHSERKQLLDANLTNQELKYIKDRTKVSAWGVENLTGKEQVDKLISEAKGQNKTSTSEIKVKGENNVIPRDFEKGYGRFKVKTSANDSLEDRFEITKDENGFHAKNLRTGETYATFGEHLRNNNVFEFENSKDNKINDSLRRKGYQKYLKEHPNSKMTFEDFKDMRK